MKNTSLNTASSNSTTTSDGEYVLYRHDEIFIRELLNEYDFPGDDTPIIQGSALKALEDPAGPWGDKIMELMDAVDSWIPDPQRDTDLRFQLPHSDEEHQPQHGQ